MSEAIYDMKAFSQMTDNVFFQILHSTKPELAESRSILSNILVRRLYKCVGQTQLKHNQVPKDSDVPKVQEDIFKKMDPAELPTPLKEEDVVILIYLDYGMKDKNPIDSVRFYSKELPNVPIRVHKDQMAESRLEDEKMSTAELASIVFNCIQEDNLCKLQGYMKKCQKSNRQAIVSQIINGRSPLSKACLQSKLHFVNYLLDECSADVDQIEPFMKTPLFHAAGIGNLDVVKTLVQHGAAINYSLPNGFTAVLWACFRQCSSTVKYLVKHGADINKQRANGRTCLMAAVTDLDLCSFLINNGADVNAQDNRKYTALHYSFEHGISYIAWLLLLHKADYTLKNCFGIHALQTAVLNEYPMDFLERSLEMAQLPVADAIRAYELLGTTLVIDQKNMLAALYFWKKAMELRYPSKSAPLLKHLPQRQSVYMHLKEPENMEELINLVDPEKIYGISLMIRERIVGPTCKYTFQLNVDSALSDASHGYEHLKYACLQNNRASVPFNKDCLFMILSLVKSVWDIQGMFGASVNSPVSMSDILDVLDILLEQIINLHAGMKMDFGILETGSSSYLHVLLTLFLHHINLMSRLESFNTQKHRYMKIIHKIIVQDPRGTHGESLLHLAVDPNISSIYRNFYSSFPSLDVIKILVECGANVDVLQDNGNSLLYDCISFFRIFHLPEQADILDYLVNKGAHMDICNYDGDCALTIIEKMVLPYSTMNYVSLKCLASRVIMKYKIPYKEVVPRSLLSFVELHGKRQD